LEGNPLPNYNIETFSKHHEQTDQKLRELKLMIIKYLPSDAHHNHQLTATLYDIFNNEEWLRHHADVEDHIFSPAIKRMERLNTQNDVSKNISSMVFNGSQESGEALSDRERDVIIGVVQGLQNKEIADRLNISVHTVITHRRNIARKLQIHSPAGLTIYAIVNGLVDISSVKL
jgi:regulator of cell morphogenesis and NO signaling